MSAQSIIFPEEKICDKIDDFLICQGRSFSNMLDYDLDIKIDYKKIKKIIILKNAMNNCVDGEIEKIIDKILRK